MNEEWVVLVDEENREVGRARKEEVHHDATPLHRGFSVFIFDDAGRTLLQRRALSKKTWPGIWSNGCCGHPAPAERVVDAARRRCREELGLELAEPWVALPDYRYRAELHGVVENEICPVLVARSAGEALRPDPDEVGDWRWLSWGDFLADLTARPQIYSPWCIEEAGLLDFLPAFHSWHSQAC